MFRLFLAAIAFTLFGQLAQAIPDDGNGGGQVQNGISAYDSCMANRGSAIDCQGESDIIGRRDGLTEEQPGAGGGGGGGQSPAQQAQATAAAAQEALNAFVMPTLTGHFSLGNLNSDNEAALYIGNDNGENNVVFRVIRLIGMLVGTVAILLYIIAGYFMIFSQGDENQLTKGKQIVAYTSLGLALVFTAYMIVQLVMGLMYFAG